MMKQRIFATRLATLVVSFAFANVIVSGLFNNTALAKEDPRVGKVTIAILCDDTGDGNRKPRLTELEDSAKHLRLRLNDTDWTIASKEGQEPEEADMIFTILDRKKEDERGLVLKYELRSGSYRQVDEFAYAGGGVAAGGIRSLSFDGDNGGVRDQVTSLGWPYHAAELAKQLDEFAELNYELIVKQREK